MITRKNSAVPPRNSSKWLALCADRHDALKSLLSASPTDALIRSEEASGYRELIQAAESFLSTVPENLRQFYAPRPTAVHNSIPVTSSHCGTCRCAVTGSKGGV